MAAVGRRDSFLNNIILLCIFLLIIMMSASSSKAITNELTTGQTLSWAYKLGYAESNVSLTINFCNLVVYDDKGDAKWESGTGGLFTLFCTLSLTDKGRLVITGFFGDQLWISNNTNSTVGKYIAVLLPEAKLVIYGPEIWAVGVPTVKESNIGISSNSDINNNEMVPSLTNLKNIPAIRNVLFSGQKLYNGGNISENGYTFILDDCELILKDSRGKNKWQTFTHGIGINCFARLGHYGKLAIFDEQLDIVWTNELALPKPYGNYALAIQSNGTATIYGPSVWSTGSVNLGDGLIKMTTVEM